MPVPVSRIVSSAARPSADRPTTTAISPSKVNLKAFESRFRTTFSHISRSTWTGSGSGAQSTIRRSPARSIAERKLEASSAVNAARSVDR